MPALRNGEGWLKGRRPEAFRGGSRGQRAVDLAFGRSYGDYDGAQGAPGARTKPASMAAASKTCLARSTARFAPTPPAVIAALQVLWGDRRASGLATEGAGLQVNVGDWVTGGVWLMRCRSGR